MYRRNHANQQFQHLKFISKPLMIYTFFQFGMIKIHYITMNNNALITH